MNGRLRTFRVLMCSVRGTLFFVQIDENILKPRLVFVKAPGLYVLEVLKISRSLQISAHFNHRYGFE